MDVLENKSRKVTHMKVRKTYNEWIAAEIERSLQENDGYCPCKIQKTQDTKCMCKEFREQIRLNIQGPCHCGLWGAETEENYEVRA